jgi:hypothetical protein
LSPPDWSNTNLAEVGAATVIVRVTVVNGSPAAG